jgi:nucleotide-binding universal stress UspA family protein
VNRLVTFPAPECDRFCSGLFSKLLYATDFSDSAEFALEAVRRCVAKTKAAVHLVHVQDVSRIRPHLEDQLERFNDVDRQRLARIADALSHIGAREVTQEIQFDHAARGILQAIEAWQPNLVVLGSQGRGYISEVLLGGTAHRVACLSPAPVLLVPTPRQR